MTLSLPKLRTDQRDITTFAKGNAAQVAVVCMGRRWGKSTMGGVLVALAAVRGWRVAWMVPSYKNGRPLWRFIEQHARPLQAQRQAVLNKTERTMDVVSGGFLGIYSGDSPDSILGEAFHLVVIDEAARIAEEVWTDAIQPTLADYGGRALLISTPKGRNWFWREWTRGMSGDPSVRSFRAPSSANPNPRIQAASDLARTRVSDRTYRQEWLAEFVDDGGGVFRNVSAAATAEPQERSIEGHQYVMGCDWGRTNDATVFVVIDMQSSAVCAMDRMVDTNYALQVARLRALWERFRKPTIIAEQNSMGGPIIEQIQRSGIPVTPFITSNATKATAIDALALAFEQQRLRILPDAACIAELEAYESERLPSGALRYGAPSGMHDDYVMALALAWSGANSPMQRAMDHYAQLAQAQKDAA